MTGSTRSRPARAALKYLDTSRPPIHGRPGLPENVFDIYFQKLEAMQSEGQEVTLPIGTSPCVQPERDTYKKLTIRS